MKVIKIALILNYLFWGGVFIYSFSMYTAHNGLFDVFEFKCIYADEFQVDLKDNKKSYYVRYLYTYNNKVFSNKEGISKKIYDEEIGNIDKLEICYNTTFPSLSHLGQRNLAIRRNKVGMVVSLIFLAFFMMIDIFADKKKWVLRYKKAFGANTPEY